MQKKNNYKNIILQALYEHEIIDKNLYEKCSKPSYIQDLPGDLRTKDGEILQARYDEIKRRINEIREEYGWFTPPFVNLRQTAQAREKRMQYYEENFKKIDEKIYEECKDLVDELKPLMDEVNEIYQKYGDSYSTRVNFGEYGLLNTYESFYLFCNQFKKENAGKGNVTLEDGFHSWSPNNFSFENGNSFLNYALSNIIDDTNFALEGHTIYDINKGKLPKEDMDAMPKDEINNILYKLSDLKSSYTLECQKVYDDYNNGLMKEINKTGDYQYELDKLEQHCKNNNIPLRK